MFTTYDKTKKLMKKYYEEHLERSFILHTWF